MLQLETSAEAKKDLYDIWFHIVDDSPLNADKFLNKLSKKMEFLREFSEAGVLQNVLMDGLRSFPVDRYMIYYQIKKDSLVVVRVLHGTRDIQSIFEMPSTH